VLRCPALPPPLHLLGAVMTWPPMSWRDRLSVLRMGPPLLSARRELARTGTLRNGDAMTVSRWLEARGQTEKLTAWLWEPLALAALNQSPDEALATPFVRVLAEMFGPDPQAASIAFPSVSLDALYGAPARDHIDARGGHVMTNALARVIVEAGRAVGVRARGGCECRARAVVSAVPWFALGGLFGEVPPPLQRIVSDATRMGAYPIVTVNLWLDRGVLATPFIGLPGRTMQWAFDRGAITDSRLSYVSLVSSGAAAVVGMRNDAIVGLALRELRDALPPARLAAVRKAVVVRERRATFSLAPGQPARPSANTPLDGFYLAGDWTDTGLPGTIESAAMSGHRAADAIERGGS
jgi:hydroxysqualene dehydroxylase